MPADPEQQGGRVIALNLIPIPIREASANWARVRTWYKLLVAALCVAAAVVAESRTRDNPSRAAWASVSELESQIDARRRELASLRGESSVLAKELESVAAVSHHPDWTPALRMLADRLGEDLVLDSCVLNRPRDLRPAITRGSKHDPAAIKPGSKAGHAHAAFSIELGGLATTQTAVHRYLADVQASGLFDAVTLIETRTRTLGDRSLVGFRLSCEIFAPVDPAFAGTR